MAAISGEDKLLLGNALYPRGDSLLGGLMGSISSSLGLGGGGAPVPRGTVR
ncbi:MAG: hypothetical protein IPG60_08010 [Bacteroidetes bacterium]|nr:hypothetical protein [Bacteroidota bacterium]